MKQELKDYLKCATGNRFTLGGYLAMSLFPLLGVVEYNLTKKFPILSVSLFEFGWISLLLTGCGSGTLKTYREVKEHIQKHGTIDPRFKEKYSEAYCDKIGIKLAAKEVGLEHLI